MITFPQFVEMFAADSADNQHAIISREGRIMIQGRWGCYTYDTLDDFLRAHQSSASAEALLAAADAAQRKPADGTASAFNIGGGQPFQPS